MGLRKQKQSVWEIFVDKCFAPAIAISPEVKDISFPPSTELIQELDHSFTLAWVELFDNGSNYSAYHVDYNIGGHTGAAIYKTTTTLYPGSWCLIL